MIGVIDSGSGGINVILECTKYYNEDFVYLVDNKNCPYGNKSQKLLKEILNKNIKFLIDNYDLDLIIIACNTISALIDYSFMLEYKIPILKTSPNIKNIKKNGENLLVFATKNTIFYNKELKLLKLNYPKVRFLYIKNLPKFIDNYLTESSKNNELYLNKLLKSKFNKRYKNISIISLGCTHFKHIQKNIQNNIKQNIDFWKCEEKVAKNSKWLVRKNKKQNSIKILLTNFDKKLASGIKKLAHIENCSVEYI